MPMLPGIFGLDAKARVWVFPKNLNWSKSCELF